MRVTEYHSEYYGKSVTEVARIILSKHDRVCANAVKELRDATGHSLLECKDLLMELQRQKRMERLESENAKLREIIVTLVFCANNEADCDQCPMNGIHCDEVQSCFCDEMADELRKLGMEIKNGLEAQV